MIKPGKHLAQLNKDYGDGVFKGRTNIILVLILFLCPFQTPDPVVLNSGYRKLLFAFFFKIEMSCDAGKVYVLLCNLRPNQHIPKLLCVHALTQQEGQGRPMVSSNPDTRCVHRNSNSYVFLPQEGLR